MDENKKLCLNNCGIVVAQLKSDARSPSNIDHISFIRSLLSAVCDHLLVYDAKLGYSTLFFCIFEHHAQRWRSHLTVCSTCTENVSCRQCPRMCKPLLSQWPPAQIPGNECFESFGVLPQGTMSTDLMSNESCQTVAGTATIRCNCWLFGAEDCGIKRIHTATGLLRTIPHV